MQDESRLTPADMELERVLAGLAPAGAQGLRDRVMFKAGLARGRRAGRIWQGGCVCLGLMLAVSVCLRPGTPLGRTVADATRSVQPVEQVPLRGRSGPSPSAEYLSLRRAVLEQGMDALPDWRPVPCDPGQVASAQEYLNGSVL